MTALWFILAVMTGAAVFALLWPMSRRANPAAPPEAGGLATETGFYEDQLREIERDQARGLIAAPEAEAARTEAARRLLRANRAGVPAAQDIAEPALRQRRAASAFALSTIPLVALIAYGLYGSPHMPAQGQAERSAAQTGDQDLLKAIGQIEARLAADPTDGRGWSVLAPVYMRMGRFDDAAHAYEAAARLLGETPQRLSDWGEALVAGSNGAVTPQAKAIFQRAVDLDAQAAKPRFYLARGAELDGDIPEAIRRLQAMAEAAPADAPWLPLVRENLARLKGEAAPASPDSDRAAALQALPPASRDGAIRAMVDSLDKRLADRGGTLEDWLRLVRSYGVLKETDKAAAALERARKALADEPEAKNHLDEMAREIALGANAAPVAPAANPDEAGRAGTEAAVAAVKAMPAAERDAAIRGMVAGLDRRLASKGGSIDDWLRLVRSYSALGERDKAAQTLDRARMALSPDPGAIERLDELSRELQLRPQAPRPAPKP
ncbi:MULTISPECIES: c-type cytochrome biogenesis protein CcmI [unclassified Methylobacterium]|uniref:c-type cytochrome biogenesis protein CcmI n=1 Tax=unclassified Methylobacterium TaxID=2615210 RepID=UPI0006FDB280|nr:MULTISPECIES: c-type cytochrome biogenesis protein CcmI [unclassified Methylobacterium]KQP88510.1 cytochrome C [Methylobacterium sp. Leaf117]MCK2055549.1 c-type cytochrome biogenesis protein CcmI [Methylobacterium sp. 37f]